MQLRYNNNGDSPNPTQWLNVDVEQPGREAVKTVLATLEAFNGPGEEPVNVVLEWTNDKGVTHRLEYRL